MTAFRPCACTAHLVGVIVAYYRSAYDQDEALADEARMSERLLPFPSPSMTCLPTIA